MAKYFVAGDGEIVIFAIGACVVRFVGYFPLTRVTETSSSDV